MKGFPERKPLKLIGVNRHQDLLGKANALSNAEHISDMEMIKSNGRQFFRTAHYPSGSGLVMDACARLCIFGGDHGNSLDHMI